MSVSYDMFGPAYDIKLTSLDVKYRGAIDSSDDSQMSSRQFFSRQFPVCRAEGTIEGVRLKADIMPNMDGDLDEMTSGGMRYVAQMLKDWVSYGVHDVIYFRVEKAEAADGSHIVSAIQKERADRLVESMTTAVGHSLDYSTKRRLENANRFPKTQNRVVFDKKYSGAQEEPEMLTVYACGHTAKYAGEESDAQASFKLCPLCASSNGKVDSVGRIALIGSEKQVKWALSIREVRADEIAVDPELVTLFGQTIVNILLTQQYASWWIETQHLKIEHLLKAVAKQKQLADKGVIALGSLDGTPRMVEWASQVRTVMVTKFVLAYIDIVAEMKADAKRDGVDPVVLKTAGKLLRRALQYSAGVTSSSTWIDLRETNARTHLVDQFHAIVGQQSNLREAAAMMRMRGTSE